MESTSKPFHHDDTKILIYTREEEPDPIREPRGFLPAHKIDVADDKDDDTEQNSKNCCHIL